jgi:sec-independent protein translocase protein TatB
MLPGVGFGEILVLVILALIVVGPGKLPKLTREISGFIRRMRAMATDFRETFDEMGRQAELDELRREIDAMKRLEPIDDIRRELRGAEAEMRNAPGNATSGTARSDSDKGEP